MNQITERIDRDAYLGRSSVFAARLAELVGHPGTQALATVRIGYPEHSGCPRRVAPIGIGRAGLPPLSIRFGQIDADGKRTRVLDD